MKSNSYIIEYFRTGSLFLILGVGIIFYGCSSSDSPFQTSSGPSSVSGTVFETPLEFDSGENPISIVSGDFNGDNEIDLVVASSRKQDGISTTADGTLTLLQYSSSSNSRFPFVSSTINPTTEEWRQDIVSIDYSGDNITDLVVTHTDDDKIKFLLNDGSANFSDNGSIDVGDVPLSIISGDWNNDNQTDLVVVNRGDSSVSILQNSNGVFSLSQTLSVDERPIRIVSGDWDADSDEDLAVLLRDSTQIQIWLNTGTGSFSKQSTSYSVGSSPIDMITGDWDCDENLDLAVSNSGEDTISLIYGEGNGTFASPVAISTGRGPGSMTSADFNNDNKMDFVVGHRFLVSTPGVALLTGDFSLTLSDTSSATGYASSVSFAATIEKDGAPPAEIIIIDADNDSKLDLLITLPLVKKLAVLCGNQYTGSLTCP